MSSNNSKQIILLGDALLDSYLYFERKDPNLSTELIQLGYNVNNHSIIELTLDGLLSKITVLDDEGDMVVISIGSYDLRNNIFRLILGVDALFNAVVTSDYIKKYSFLIDYAKKHNRKVVIVAPYYPYSGPDATYKPFEVSTTAVITRWIKFITELADKHNVAVLDLSTIIDKNIKEHYSESQIQISSLSCKHIAEQLDMIYNN